MKREEEKEAKLKKSSSFQNLVLLLNSSSSSFLFDSFSILLLHHLASSILNINGWPTERSSESAPSRTLYTPHLFPSSSIHRYHLGSLFTMEKCHQWNSKYTSRDRSIPLHSSKHFTSRSPLVASICFVSRQSCQSQV